MELSTIQELIENHIDGATVIVEGDGCSCSTQVISDAFLGLGLLQKQRLVMEAVNEFISSGELHALSIQTFTKDEWADHIKK